jgi:ribosomal protein S4
MHGQQNDKYTEINGQQNDKYNEMHGQQNDKYTEMHGQQNIKIRSLSRFPEHNHSIHQLRRVLVGVGSS